MRTSGTRRNRDRTWTFVHPHMKQQLDEVARERVLAASHERSRRA